MLADIAAENTRGSWPYWFIVARCNQAKKTAKVKAIKERIAQRGNICELCGEPLPPRGRRGPPRLYCSNACRQAAYRRRLPR